MRFQQGVIKNLFFFSIAVQFPPKNAHQQRPAVQPLQPDNSQSVPEQVISTCSLLPTHYLRPAMQQAQSYSIRGQRSSGQLTGKPSQSTGVTGLSRTWRWEPLAWQQAQALALAPAQPITPASKLTLSAPGVTPDVTEPDVSIAEEDHEAWGINGMSLHFQF
ncbi:UNVERIFIED_CONTAM: hypothetical protein FKN15_002609 [Acipenser sinensis]